MAEPSAGAPPPLRALLIGIDRYLPNSLRDGPYYPSLRGAVADVERVERYLLGALETPPERLRKLTAPYPGLPATPAGDDGRPTYANLVAAFQRLEAECERGDHALVHYSGHGGRTRTAAPELKGEGALDECLVPMDVGDPGVRYLRDLDLAAFLARMDAKGVFVTLVLDCCHSGGATRRNLRVRGVDRVDGTLRPADSLLATADEIAAAWRRLAAGATRSVQLGEGRALRPRGYALLAACRPHERALEDSIDGAPPGGALTHYLLAALREMGGGATYRGLHAALVARIHTRYPSQTPMLEGEGDRLIFGRDELPTLWGVNVLSVEQGEAAGGPGRILLNTGAVQGVGKGARFAVYPASARDASDPGLRLALVEIEEVGATESWAAVKERFASEPSPGPGDQAVLIDPGPPTLVRGVEILRGRSGETVVAGEEAALDRVAALLARDRGDGLLRVATADGAADFQLAVGAGGVYEIRDAGGEPLANLGPPLRIDAPRPPHEPVRRLAHLARFANIRALVNPDLSSPLHGRLRLAFELLPDGAPQEGVPARAEPLTAPRHLYEVETGTWLRLTLHNDSPDPLNVVVLDLQPDWGVSQVFPAPTAGAYHTLDPGAGYALPLEAYLPDDLDEGTDVLKAFATAGPVSFRWLELPALHDPAPGPRWTATRGVPANPLERLLAALGAARPPGGALRCSDHAGHEWVTAQVELWVVRRGA